MPKPLQTVREAFERARSVPKVAEPTSEATETNGGMVTGDLSKMSTGPMPIHRAEFMMGDRAMVLATGLYLLTGPAAAGKSVVALAIAFSAVKSSDLSVGKIYFFEVGSPVYPEVQEVPMFTDPSKFLYPGKGGDLEVYLDVFLRKRNSGSKPALLVLDSIGEPMRAYMSDKRTNMPAASEGMQAADRMFVERLNAFAERYALIILGVVNSEQVPFVERLYGATQGIINVETATAFNKRDRVTGRDKRSFTVPNIALRNALAAMRYTAKPTADSTSINY